MFGLSASAGTVSLIRRNTRLTRTSGAKVIKRVSLRKSPRRIAKNMPSAIIEQVQFTIVQVRIAKGPSRFPRDDKFHKYFTAENWFNYPDLALYYGPSNVTHIIQFIEMVQAQKAQTPEKSVCLVVKADSDQALNAVLLCSAYLMLVDNVHPKEAVLKVNPILRQITKTFYKTEGEELTDDLHISVLDCLQGLKVFMNLNLVDLDTIDVEEYN
ncbi:hypothetical protein PSACC_02464 [Paramicrosporidium saccamoebae]|uniref:Dual specificity/tyrosine protein phosphatase N-terminal domain-containing protein n=1 Tax=Paramicrosporidium saccamoebae TaxID=1246581 RepID=A0A2H9TIZ7_9FUNG|nr:hypothetical protein PSACC_02464 [Paramicrosporidium saccamoebae]